VHPANTVKVPHDKIAMRAYEKWCQRGKPPGTSQVQDWLEAERELQAEFARTGTFGTRR
jgi:hypothetical protein